MDTKPHLYRCSSCPASFRAGSALSDHCKSTSHPLPTWDCQLCSKPFLSSNSLDQHLLRFPKHARKFALTTKQSSKNKAAHHQRQDQGQSVRGDNSRASGTTPLKAKVEQTTKAKRVDTGSFVVSTPGDNISTTATNAQAQSRIPESTPITKISYTELPLNSYGYMRSILLVNKHSSLTLDMAGYRPWPKWRSAPAAQSLSKRVQVTKVSQPVFEGIKYRCVVLDVEMAKAETGGRIPISLCLLDFFSGMSIINALIKPTQSVENWKSDIHGITAAIMKEAETQGRILLGRRAAQDEVFKYINSDTIIIGHSLQNDLQALQIRHTNIIDTSIISNEALWGRTGKVIRTWGLEPLCKEFIGITIRAGEAAIHDPLEDVLATRELLLYFLHNPVKLFQWAEEARVVAREEAEKRKRQQQQQQQNKDKAAVKLADNRNGESSSQPWPTLDYSQMNSSNWCCSYHAYGNDDADSEVLRWEDVVDWEMWPKSPPSD